jgi:hypothetical protein|tara:strand:+ start:692 stop:1390 length:699 start_codon:yes stop_codon:yes gene_type:complete
MLNRESTIQILYSETSGVTPDSTLLKDGELAINSADEKIFFKGSDDGLKEIHSSNYSVSSINGETGDISKLYGNFKNISPTEFTGTSGITIDGQIYNSDSSGLTLYGGGIKITKAGVYKITTDVTIGLTGATPSTALGTKTNNIYVVTFSGNEITTAISASDTYHSFARAAPGGIMGQACTTSSSIIQQINQSTIDQGPVSIRISSGIDFGTLGSGTFISPAGGTRITIEEL